MSMNKNRVKVFQRSEEYSTKIFLDALDRHVILDAKLRCVHGVGRKIRVWCEASDTYVQFPTNLRRYGREFIADVIKAKKESGAIFYRAYRGSIRDPATGEVLA